MTSDKSPTNPETTLGIGWICFFIGLLAGMGFGFLIGN